ncbi:hypothetical protein GO988_21500 [Hymenobacter sp. HMF4947]|uniref:Uncharacterized protein n=1 Tax=Hymenobacter ginkgonis TaxID=2682976 RepID=A0A7K1TKL7_9BACT|nr:hypothetical protein [Hymenobacter ginkgonis]MVN78913.1 hypothetical protein [Hymenobacter ginkgonis]
MNPALLTPPSADQQRLLDKQRRLTQLLKESNDTLHYHDLRRTGLEGTRNAYQAQLAEVTTQLNAPPPPPHG